MCGHAAIVARTGYTGEDGFEIFVAPADAADALWRRLIEAGPAAGPRARRPRRPRHAAPRGAHVLYGNDMDETTTLVEAGLGWIVSLDEAKGDFTGRAVLLEQKTKGAPRKLVGFEMIERGIARHGYPVFLGDEATGSVTSGSYAPFLQKNIGLCYLPTARAGGGHRDRGRNPRPPRRRRASCRPVLQAPALRAEEALMYPQDLRYTKDHEWIAVEGDRGTVGITDYAQKQLGDVVFLELPEVGRTLKAGEQFGTVESVKAVSELSRPVAGEVVEVNAAARREARDDQPGPARRGLDDRDQARRPGRRRAPCSTRPPTRRSSTSEAK